MTDAKCLQNEYYTERQVIDKLTYSNKNMAIKIVETLLLGTRLKLSETKLVVNALIMAMIKSRWLGTNETDNFESKQFY